MKRVFASLSFALLLGCFPVASHADMVLTSKATLTPHQPDPLYQIDPGTSASVTVSGSWYLTCTNTFPNTHTAFLNISANAGLEGYAAQLLFSDPMPSLMPNQEWTTTLAPISTSTVTIPGGQTRVITTADRNGTISEGKTGNAAGDPHNVQVVIQYFS